MEAIIEPVSVELLEAELTSERFLRKTNKCNNEIYVVTQHNAPNVMLEIGRLREISFRASGGKVPASRRISTNTIIWKNHISN